jgi:2'-5' RNA ligase
VATRTFLAIDLPHRVRKRLAAWTRTADAWPGRIGWVNPDQLHITLHFLAQLSDEALAELYRQVPRSVGQAEPFELEIVGIKVIPPAGRRVRMIWASVGGDLRALQQIHAVLREGLQKLDLPTESRRYCPHVTLGRIRSCPNPHALRQACKPFRDAPLGQLHVENVTIYSSTLTRKGPEYRVLENVPLGSAPRGQRREGFSP